MVDLLKEASVKNINIVKIGAAKDEGGTRSGVVTIGGESVLPFLLSEGAMPHKPIVAMEVSDIVPEECPQPLLDVFGEAIKDPLEWADMCVNKFGAKLICLTLAGTHPDAGDKSPEEAAKLVKDMLNRITVPLIILGSGDEAKDNLVLAACSEAAKGERCLFGNATEKNYKTLTASCLADGHNIIGESPIDVNIAKQVNILIGDMGMPTERIVINPTVGALGYGMEYTYSIMERARIAALRGDAMLAMPFICLIGQDVWKTKEAKAPESERPEWGELKERGPMWEYITAVSMLQSGAGILVLSHPKAVDETRKYIDRLMRK